MSLATFRTHARTALMAGTVAILIAACGSSATPAPTTAPTVSTGSTSLGTVLVSADGHTLYVFDEDTTPGASACTSSTCTSTWYALTTTGTPTAGAGVTGTLATFTRSDGGTQVSYNGKPLYNYVADVNAGDTGGDGIDGTWHIATP